jgi:tryptophan synthase alpha subunit
MKVINETDADGVVVGSAILELILKNAGKEELAVFIRSLKKATRRS